MGAATRPKAWRKLTRRDIPGFDETSTKVVLYAMEQEGVARISAKGHAIVRAPNGQTMGVAPKSNKSVQVMALNLRRLFPEATNGRTLTITEPPKEKMTMTTPAHTSETARPEVEYECTATSCDETFTTEGARYSHVHDKHDVCWEPGCLYAGDKRQVTAHHRMRHMPQLHPRRVGAERKRAREAAAVAAGTAPTVTAVLDEAARLEQRREAGRKGAAARWAKARAAKEQAQTAVDEAVEPAQTPAAPSGGDHTQDVVTEPTEPLDGSWYVKGGSLSFKEADPHPLPTLVGRLEAVAAQLEKAPESAVIARLDQWITEDRIKMQFGLDERDMRILELQAQVDDLNAKLNLLREVFDA